MPASPATPLSERFLVAALLGLLFWLPLPLGSNRDWAVGVLVVATGALGLLWGWQLWRRGAPERAARKPLRRGLPLLAMLLLAQGWVATQWLGGLSMDVGRTFQYLMLGLSYTLLFVLVLALFNTRKRLTWLLGTLVVSGTFQAFWGAAMTLSGTEWLLVTPKTHYLGDATGTFVNRNHLAGYLEMTLACGIGLLLALRDGGRFSWVSVLELLLGPKARLRLALVVMVIALVMSHSRMGNTAFFASLLLIGGLFVLLDKEHRLRNALILASIVVIDILVISQYFGLEKLKDRLINTRVDERVVDGDVVLSVNDQRNEVFGYAIPLLRERPLTGQGAGAFESVFPRFTGADIKANYDHAHNDYLQFGIEYGLLGTLPLGAFVLLALWHALRALWQRDSTYRSGVGFGAAMAILALLIHSFTDFNLQIPANAATLVVICAIAVLARTHHVPRVPRRSSRSAASR